MAGLLANVQRKRRLFAALRLMGFRRRTLMLVPVLQAGIVAMLGALIATGLALGAAAAINAGLVGISIEGALCTITPGMLGDA
jgi:putative ABC transport system permease protein